MSDFIKEAQQKIVDTAIESAKEKGLVPIDIKVEIVHEELVVKYIGIDEKKYAELQEYFKKKLRYVEEKEDVHND